MPQGSNAQERRKPSRRMRIIVRTLLAIGALTVLSFVVIRILFKPFAVPTGAMEGTILAGDWLLAERGWQPYDGDRARRGDIIVFTFPGNRDQIRPDEESYYVERCVAIAGDTLEVRGHRVFINGFVDGVEETVPPGRRIDYGEETSPNDHLRTFPSGAGFTAENWGPMRVPKKGDVIPLNDSTFDMYRIFIGREGHEIGRNAEEITVDGTPAASYLVERDYCFGMGDNRSNYVDSRYWGFIPVDDVFGVPRYIYLSFDTGSDPDGIRTIRWDRIFMRVE